MYQRIVAVTCIQYSDRLVILSSLGKIAGNLKICLMKMFIQRPDPPDLLICAVAKEVFFIAGYIIEIVQPDIVLDPCERLINPSQFFQNDRLEPSRLDIVQVLDKTLLCQFESLICITSAECDQRKIIEGHFLLLIGPCRLVEGVKCLVISLLIKQGKSEVIERFTVIRIIEHAVAGQPSDCRPEIRL